MALLRRWWLAAAWGLLTVLLYFMAWNRENLYLLAVASLLLAIAVIGVALPWLAVRATHLALELPSSVEGTPEFLDLTVTCRLPWPQEGLLLHLGITGRKQVQRSRIVLALPRIYPGRRRVRLALPPLPRGRYVFSDAELVCTQPFGMARFSRLVNNRSDALVVRPRRFVFSARAFLDGAQPFFIGPGLNARAGASSEFFGVREYRWGDSPRHIDWKASARQGELIVREFEETVAPDLLIVLDAHADFAQDRATRQAFEECVSIAASAAAAALAAGISVGLRSQDITLRSARGELQAWQLLEAFTDVQPEATGNLAPLLDPLLVAPRPAHTLLVLTGYGSPHWPDTENRLLQLAARGYHVHLVLAGPEPRPVPEPLRQRLAGYGVQVKVPGSDRPEALFA